MGVQLSWQSKKLLISRSGVRDPPLPPYRIRKISAPSVWGHLNLHHIWFCSSAVRIPGCQPEDRGFESHQDCQSKEKRGPPVHDFGVKSLNAPFAQLAWHLPSKQEQGRFEPDMALHADLTQLVECHLAMVKAVGSSPIICSTYWGIFQQQEACLIYR